MKHIPLHPGKDIGLGLFQLFNEIYVIIFQCKKKFLSWILGPPKWSKVLGNSIRSYLHIIFSSYHEFLSSSIPSFIIQTANTNNVPNTMLSGKYAIFYSADQLTKILIWKENTYKLNKSKYVLYKTRKKNLIMFLIYSFNIPKQLDRISWIEFTNHAFLLHL